MKNLKRILAMVLAAAIVLSLPAGAAAKRELLTEVTRQLHGGKKALADSFYIFPYWSTYNATVIAGKSISLKYFKDMEGSGSGTFHFTFLIMKGSLDEIDAQEEPVVIESRQYTMDDFQGNELSILWTADARYPVGDYSMVGICMNQYNEPISQSYFYNELHVVDHEIPLERIDLFSMAGGERMHIDTVAYPHSTPQYSSIRVCPMFYPPNTTVERQVTVTCSAPNPVLISEHDGFIHLSKGASIGRKEVTFRCGDVSASFEVLFGNAQSVRLTGRSTELCTGQTDTPDYEVTGMEGEACGIELSWASSDPSVATVSGGVVTAVAPGTTTVSLTAGNKTASVVYQVHAHRLSADAVHIPRTATGPSRDIGHCSACGMDAAVNLIEPAIFTDTSATAWYAPYVDDVFEAGLMNGTDAHTFSPNKTLSRAMAVTVLYRLALSPETENYAFADVEDGKWYSTPISWAKNNDIVNGYPDGGFRPNADITREQLAAILCRCASLAGAAQTGSAALSFPDAGDVHDYAKASMCWAVGSGLINGVSAQGQTLLKPGAGATRAQFAAMISRYIRLLEKQNPEAPTSGR